MNIPRPEYPRPQWVRPDWLCLNGEWQFEVDRGDSGLERGLLYKENLDQRIIVPFCPESKLSGIENTDFLNAVWYRRIVRIPLEWHGRDVRLHFGACDYDTTVWVNGHEVIRHRGGFTSFSAKLDGLAQAGKEIVIVVRARDDRLSPKPRGKQSQRYQNYGCLYTRTTGIWQTVWMEPVAKTYLRRPRITPQVAASLFRIDQPISGDQTGLRVRATLKDERGIVSQNTVAADLDLSPQLDLFVSPERRRLWSPSDPYLYDVEIELLNEAGGVLDAAKSYAGLRSITKSGKAVMLNGEVVFQRLVLDQGYYIDGLMTAPTDDDLKADIEMSMALGFNGARLHQKVFEERFLYHADKMGYLCWEEFPDWGLRGYGLEEHLIKPGITCAAQWLEVMERDYNHPSIIGWCGLNETYEEIKDDISLLDDASHAMFFAAKAFDTTRLVLDASGYSHRVPQTDVFDCHDYEQDPEKFAQNHAKLKDNEPFYNGPEKSPWSFKYRGQPFFVSEFGGIRWNPDEAESDNSWGYGVQTGNGVGTPQSLEEFYTRFEGLCAALLDNEAMFGYCYTQLTDVFQEQNGLYFFNRAPKFDVERICKIQERMAAIEAKYRK